MTRPNRPVSSALLALVILILAGAPAAAQTSPRPHVEISANVGALTGASTFTESSTLPSNGGETATITADHGVQTAIEFTAGAAVRIVPQLWVGVQFATANMDTKASITAIIPHPLLFNAPRTVQGSIDGVKHNEQNVHLDVMYALPVSGIDVRVMAGPTFFNLKQDFVSGVTVTETYPFDTATFDTATTKQLSNSAVGFNAGVDIARMFSRQLGVGALVRYSRGDVQFDETSIGHQTVRVGGIDVAAGVRLRF